MKRASLAGVAGVLGALVLAGCSADPEPITEDPDRIVLSPPSAGAPTHTHTRLIGDGTTADAGGYSLVVDAFPKRPDTVGTLDFRILDGQGRPVTDYTEEQTKLLHLYVLRTDLADFRHVHPVLGDDGTWTARVDVADPGRYRVVAEFLPVRTADDPDDGAHVVLGREVTVAGAWTPVDVAQVAAGPQDSDGVVTVTAPDTLAAGTDASFSLAVSPDAGRADAGSLNLGTFLGAYAHLTGFEIGTGAFVHAHPLGAPEVQPDGSSDLLFHTAFEQAGRYVLFVQVRVDGFLHTVPVAVDVVAT